MKLIKALLFFCVFAVIATAALSYLAPLDQKIVRSIVINAPANKVYEQMLLLQNFNKWSVWGQADSAIKYENSGTDGITGSTTTWNGNPLLSGKGTITLTGLQKDRQITHHIKFLEPRQMEANSNFDLNEKKAQTTVTWTFLVPGKRPFNIINLFYNLEKEKGADFEQGLQTLKSLLENTGPSHPEKFKALPYNFPLTKYIAIRQKVLWVDFKDFFEKHFYHLARYTLKDSITSNTKTALFYDKDEKAMQSNVAAAISIPVSLKVSLQSPEELIHIPASKAAAVTFTGGDENKIAAYKAIDDYVIGNKLKVKKPIIEEYLQADSITKTRIIYLTE